MLLGVGETKVWGLRGFHFRGPVRILVPVTICKLSRVRNAVNNLCLNFVWKEMWGALIVEEVPVRPP